MKQFLLLAFAVIFGYGLLAQCDTVAIAQSNYSLVKTSSAKGGDVGAKAFDGDNNSKWRTSGNGPHEIVIDLGKSETVTGTSFKTRWGGSGKIGSYEIYVSNDTTNWGKGERIDVLEYPINNTEDTAYFGSVSGRYVKFKFESTKGDLQLAEMVIYKNTCAANGKANQPILFPQVTKKTTTDAPFTLSASALSGNSVSYAIVSGPATISGNTVTLTKQAGKVRVKATAAETATYHQASREIEFTVINVKDYAPKITTSLVDSIPLEMGDTSMWHNIYMQVEIDESQFNSITKVEGEIDGKWYPTHKRDGFYYLSWKPKEFKTYDIKLIATGSNGIETTLTRNLNVVKGGKHQKVRSLEDVVIEFGKENSRDYYGTYVFPQHVGSYFNIYATLDVECPNGNCDDWDRWAYIDIKAPDGNWIQIIRYITPYGVACNHNIDLTQYASLLQGAVEMHVFIDTWGTGGWQLTLDMDFSAGKPDYIYSTVDEVWDGAFDFGNPANLESVPTKTINIHEGTENTILFLSATGHGWGQNNTGNAAEFYHAKHDILFNGSNVYQQDLWNKCNPNPDNCTGQRGTWQHNRAGWCPGAISPPDKISLTPSQDSSTYTLDYKFQKSYVDNCHPKNPNCKSGVTCPDCNAGYNPHYQTDAQVVSYSNKPLIYGQPKNTTGVKHYSNQNQKYNLNVYPNPSMGNFRIGVENIAGNMLVGIFGIDGTQFKRYYFNSEAELDAYDFNVSDLAKGTYFIKLTNQHGNAVKQIVIQ